MSIAELSGSNLRDKIVAQRQEMKGIQQDIAIYFLQLPTRVVFMTAEETASEIGVSSASVVRFAQTLGYDGFASLKRALQQEIQLFMDPAERVEKSLSEIADTPDALRTVLETDIVYLQHLLNTISIDHFNEAVKTIVDARRIGVCGIGSSAPLVEAFSFRMRRFKADIIPITTGGKSIYEQLHWLESGDALIVFAFLNPSEEVFISLRHAKKAGIKSIVITDLETSAAATLGDVVLIGKRGPVGSFHSQLVPSAIVNGLMLAYAKQKGSEPIASLRRFLDIRSDLTEEE